VIGIKYGPVMAASDRFTISIEGKGGHGAVPDGTVDAIVAGSHLVTQLQTIVARNCSPLDPAVVTVGCFNSGYSNNIIADRAVLKGTIRSLKDSVRTLLITRMRDIIAGIDRSFGTDTKFEFYDGYPSTVNRSKAHVALVSSVAGEVVGPENVQSPEPTMGAEDYSFFLNQVDGAFFFVGSSPSTTGEVYPHHKSQFDIDERSLAIAASVTLRIVENLLYV